MNIIFSTKELIIAIPAFVGMALGIYNLVDSILRNRISLKVIPKSVSELTEDQQGNVVFKWSPHSFNPKNMSDYIAIEIINKGNIPVTVDAVGFISKGNKIPLNVYKPVPADGGDWPRRLGTREAVTIVGNFDDFLASKKSKNVVAAFAETQCGVICKGKSKALLEIVEYAKNA